MNDSSRFPSSGLSRALVLCVSSALCAACGGAESADDGEPSAGGESGGSGGVTGVDALIAEADALVAGLEDESYADFNAEAAPHESPVHSLVRTFFNDVLVGSFESESASHPLGAAAVKEIYQSDGETLRGWAVSFKVADAGNDRDWYWYEQFDDRSPAADARGASVCVDCHGAGRDYVLTPFPFP
jgi:hypothetical protein